MLNKKELNMPKTLLIVESPAKAKTIGKYLGTDYVVMASYGHVRDLIPKEGAVDPQDNFKMTYQNIDRNARHMDAIKKAMKSCGALLLAPDPDREGEAIAWHIENILSRKKALENKTVGRVVFHQITKKAIQEAVHTPREINMSLVNAQQARRALDYLVGFTLSPLLWKKVRAGLSAGRVQSPALRLIVEREKAIRDFTAQEYWSIHAALKSTEGQPACQAKLTVWSGDKLGQFDIPNEEAATQIHQQLSADANGQLTVDKVTKKSKKRQPAAPFITSTLQQEAARKLGFSAQKTMQIAQQLYEGIDTGHGASGLITYMRTDSVTLAQEAIHSIRAHIETHYDPALLPKSQRHYQTKTKNAQEAHEAIRPTDINTRPDQIKRHLSPDQYKLYSLIWKRTLASQMIDATINMVAVDFAAKDHRLRTNGSRVAAPGFITVYEEGNEDKVTTSEEDHHQLPEFTVGQVVPLEAIIPKQHFTDPPPRYTEASLIKALEEYGIGRPSTYASIISTLKNREYVTLEKKRFHATDVAIVVGRFLTNYFERYVDYHFTAELEDQLDAISRGDADWIPLLSEFWSPFKATIDDIAERVQRSDVTQEKIDEQCPECEADLSIRLGKSGSFIGCTAYPDCKYTRNINPEANVEPERITDRDCPKCHADLVIKHGRYGKFIGCSSYPDCKHIEPINKPKNTEVTCPACQKGDLFQRQSRRGKIFYSCEHYPTCDYALWNEPLSQACPQCAFSILSLKITKRSGTEIVCPQKDCDFSEPYTGEKTDD
jgi:DNA topoisomerase-1